jgi:hypothetical protein
MLAKSNFVQRPSAATEDRRDASYRFARVPCGFRRLQGPDVRCQSEAAFDALGKGQRSARIGPLCSG